MGGLNVIRSFGDGKPIRHQMSTATKQFGSLWMIDFIYVVHHCKQAKVRSQ